VSTQILIPLKRLAGAKQRLHPALGDDERRRLMLAMVEHVAREAVAADAGPVALASSEPRAPGLAQAFGIGHVTDGGLPWNEGLAHARNQLTEPLELVVYLAGDLPLVQARDIRALLVATPPRGIAIGRAHDGGTNALAVRPVDALDPSFGAPGSAAVHAERAAAAGLEAVTVDRPGLALDVDTPDDVIRARLSLTA
jgi:2-phospho-L-lactate guanylyltransferase